MHRCLSWRHCASLWRGPVAVAAGAAHRCGPRTQRSGGSRLTDFPRSMKLAENVYGYGEIRAAAESRPSACSSSAPMACCLADGQGKPSKTERLLRRNQGETAEGGELVHRGLGSRGSYRRQLGAARRHQLHRASDRAGADRRTMPQVRCRQPARGGRPLVVPPAAMAGDVADDRPGPHRSPGAVPRPGAHGWRPMVYLPGQKILFMTEAYLNRVFPAMRSAYPREWVGSIEKALAMDVNATCPDMVSWRRQGLTRRAGRIPEGGESGDREVTRLHGRGLSAEDARQQANWGPYTEWILGDQQASLPFAGSTKNRREAEVAPCRTNRTRISRFRPTSLRRIWLVATIAFAGSLFFAWNTQTLAMGCCLSAVLVDAVDRTTVHHQARRTASSCSR